MIGIIGALKIEIELIKQELKEVKQKTVSGIVFYSGKYENTDVVCAVCGVGKVFAAVCCQTMILEYKPEVIINTGIGGSLCKDLHILDCVVSDKTVQHDMDTSAVGDPVGMVSGVNMVYFESDKQTGELLLECLKSEGINAKLATIASGDQFVSTEDRKEYIVNTFGASVCDMESAALGQVCYINNVKFVAVRAISDNSDENIHMDYPQMCKAAALNSSGIVLKYIKENI